MLLKGTNRQRKMEFVYIEDLVPKDHILRKIDKYIDFSLINDLCRPYYCENNGRPAIEPEIMFKMLFIGYLFGIRSETRLVEDVKPYRERLEYQIGKFGFKVETVGLDAGYNTSAICKMLLEDFKIQAAMGKRRGCQQKAFVVMCGKIIGMRYMYLHILTGVRKYTQNEKRKSSVALQNQKNCMVYAIAVCAETKEFSNNACLLQRYRI